MKNFFRRINPIRLIETPIKRRLVRYAFDILTNWVKNRVKYHPLQNYIVRLLRRIKPIVKMYISTENRSEVLRNYWQDEKVGIINDQVVMLQALSEAEIGDKELANIVKETVAKLEAWKVKRLQARGQLKTLKRR